MMKTLCLLALTVLSVKSDLSWEVAVISENVIELYNSNMKIASEVDHSKDFTELAYDSVNDILLVVNQQENNASILSYDLATKKQKGLIVERYNEIIQGVTFDPVQGILFWTEAIERSINWISMKPGSWNDIHGNRLIKLDDEIPTAIAVDSCKGYIYWTSTNLVKYTIERARFDGTEREVLVHADGACDSLAIDQYTEKIYWAENKQLIHYSIESADLNGENRKALLADVYYRPTGLTVSKESIYWVNSVHSAIWKLSKYPAEDEAPVKYIELDNGTLASGVAANYPLEQQISFEYECDALTNLWHYKSANQNSNDDDPDQFCVYGTKVNGSSQCKCRPGYMGDRCGISICYNYCLHGECSVEEDAPKCSCDDGYKGKRCEIDACTGYCLNNGICIRDLWNNEPGCLCTEGYIGLRCEALDVAVEPKESVQFLAPLCTCNDEQTYEELTSYFRIKTDMLRYFTSIVLDLKVLGLWCMCLMLIVMIVHYWRRLSSKANNTAVNNLMPISEDRSIKQKILDDDPLITV